MGGGWVGCASDGRRACDSRLRLCTAAAHAPSTHPPTRSLCTVMDPRLIGTCTTSSPSRSTVYSAWLSSRLPPTAAKCASGWEGGSVVGRGGFACVCVHDAGCPAPPPSQSAHLAHGLAASARGGCRGRTACTHSPRWSRPQLASRWPWPGRVCACGLRGRACPPHMPPPTTTPGGPVQQARTHASQRAQPPPPGRL